jgi:hypothetical protein
MTDEDQWQGPRPGRIDLKDADMSQRDACLAVCDDAEVWRSPDGDTYATVRIADHWEHHPIDGRPFRDWLLSEVAARYSHKGRPASANDNAVKEALNQLNARAYVDGIVHPARLRLTRHEDRIFIDTGWPSWEVFQVSPDGWSIEPWSPVPLIRSRRTGKMVEPAERTDFGALRMLLRDLKEPEFVLLLSWCLMLLWPGGPYPIGLLTGEQGSGKSTKARLIQRLVDPVAGNLLQPPDNDRDLIAAARHGHVLAFDNMSGIKADLADSICRLSTGAEIGGRALFTNHDSASFAACRPILCNGIPHLANRGDLADRSLVIRLAALEERMSDAEFWAKAEEALPGALAGLLDALVLGLQQFGQTKTPKVRMADFAKLILAAEERLPWRSGAFMEAYTGNRSHVSAALVEGDEVAQRVIAFADRYSSWSGLASDLYKLLSEELSPEQKRTLDWPKNANRLGSLLTRAAPALRDMGVSVVSKHTNRGTLVTIAKVSSPSSPGPEMADSRHSQGDEPGDDKKVSSPFDAVSSPPKPRESAMADDGDNGDDAFRYSPNMGHHDALSPDDMAFLDEWAAQ